MMHRFLPIVAALLMVVLSWSVTFAQEPSKDPILRIETKGHTGKIEAADIDQAGTVAATVAGDKTVRVWETGTGRLLKTLRVPIDNDHEGNLNAVAVSPDGVSIAAGGATGRSWDDSFVVYLFNASSGHMTKRLTGMRHIIRDLRFSRDGKYLVVAAGGQGGELVVFDLAHGAVIARHSFNAAIVGIDLAADGQMAAVTHDAFVYYFHSFQDQSPRKLELADASVPASCRFNPRADRLAIGFASSPAVQLIYLKDMSHKLLTPRLHIRKALGFCSVAWSADGQQLYAAGQPGADNGQAKRLIVWEDGGDGSESHLSIAAQTKICALLPTRTGTFFFAASHWGVGEIDLQGRLLYAVKMEKASFQYNHDYFAVSADGAIVRFSYTPYGQDGAAFDIASRYFVKGKKTDIDALVSLPKRTAERIDLQHWDGWGRDKVIPRLNNKPLTFFEQFRGNPLSFGIAPDEQSFFIGAMGTLLRFSRNGRLIWRVPVVGGALSLAVSKDGRFVVVGMSDGTIRWHLQSDGSEQLALFPHPDRKHWVAWTPEGYFDASPESAELIGYHINQGKAREAKFVAMSYLYDVFYRPDIIQARFKGENIQELVRLTADEALKSPPPEVRFTKLPSAPVATQATLCYQIKNTGGGIGEVRLFQNGKLIKSDGYYREIPRKAADLRVIPLAGLNSRALYTDLRSLAVHDRKAGIATVLMPKGDMLDECLTVETIAGENEISVVAFNAANTVQSFVRTASFSSTRPPAEPHLYILAIGIDRYKDKTISLKYAAKDARDFITTLPEKARTLYKPANIHLITLANEQAGKQQIMQTIAELATKIRPGDGFIFYDASHGVLLDNQYYIVTASFRGDLADQGSLISSNEIVEISKRIKSLSQLFVFDTCHAGGVDAIVSGLYDARISVLAKKMGLHVYASAGSVQTALDGYKGNGLYTYTLLQGMRHEGELPHDANGYVTVSGLGSYSRDKTSEISTRLGHPQTPLIINFGRDNPLFSVR